jgi:hypothetical protein
MQAIIAIVRRSRDSEISDFVHSEEQVLVVMFVRQKLKQQNLESGQKWQLPLVLQLIKKQAATSSNQRDSCQQGVIVMVDTGQKMSRLELALMVFTFRLS